MLPGQPPRQAINLDNIPDCNAFYQVETGSVWFNFTKVSGNPCNRVMVVGIGNVEFVELNGEDFTDGKVQDITGTRKKKNG